MLAGIALKPATRVDVLWDILDSADANEKPDVRLGQIWTCTDPGAR